MRVQPFSKHIHPRHILMFALIFLLSAPFSTSLLAYQLSIATPPMTNPHAPHPGPNTSPASGIVGLALHITATKIGEPARLIIRAVHPSGPASRSGIAHGEEIVSVNEQTLQGKTYQEAVMLIRGEIGTSVKLGLQGPQGERTVSVVRVNESVLMEQTPQTM
jgi:S1-C subfamily serine protease